VDRYFEVHSGPRETAFALHYFPEFQTCLGPNTEDITISGQYATSDPRKANVDEAATMSGESCQFLVDFIALWKSIPVPKCYSK
jgi:hypothetical protein